MIIKRLKIQNLFSYKDADIDLTELTNALFKGNNGAGKSSLFDIMCWVMFGETARKKYKTIIRNVPDKPKIGKGIIWIVTDDGEEIRIERMAGTKKGVMLFDGNSDVPKKLRLSTFVQNEIEAILGMDKKTFLNIAYFSQGDVGRFLSSESSERIKIITDILDLDKIDRLKKNIEKQSDDFIHQYENIKGQLAVYRNKVDGVDVKKLQKENKMISSSIDEKVKRIVELSQDISNIKIRSELAANYHKQMNSYNMVKRFFIKDINEKKDEIKKLKRKCEQKGMLEKKIEGYRKEIDAGAGFIAEMKELEKKILSYVKRISGSEADVRSLQNDIVKNESVIKLKGQRCPTCNVVVGEKSLKHFHFNLQQTKDKIKGLNDLIKSLEEKKSIAVNRKMRINKEIDKINSLRAKLGNIKMELNQISENEILIKEKTSNIIELNKQYKNELVNAKTNIDKIKNDLSYYKEYDGTDGERLQNEFSILEDKRQSLENKFTENKIMIQSYYDSIKKIHELGDNIKIFDKQKQLTEFWKDALPRIKVMMISEIIPFVEAETNRYLASLLTGKYIEFKVDPSKTNNKIDIIIHDTEHKVKRIYEGWSGSEKDKMSTSIFLALNKLASLRSGKQVNFLILDEKFSSLDDISLNTMLELLGKEYEGRYIWAISHVKNIENNFRQIVQVEKVNNISTIKIKKVA